MQDADKARSSQLDFGANAAASELADILARTMASLVREARVALLRACSYREEAEHGISVIVPPMPGVAPGEADEWREFRVPKDALEREATWYHGHACAYYLAAGDLAKLIEGSQDEIVRKNAQSLTRPLRELEACALRHTCPDERAPPGEPCSPFVTACLARVAVSECGLHARI